MSEIDLIPSQYRQLLLMRKYWHHFFIAALCLSLVALLIYLILSLQLRELSNELRDLQREKAVSTLQSEDLVRLTAEKEDLNRQWQLLNGLRGGTSAQDMFHAIDQALQGEEVWFQRWDFNRAGTVVSEKNSAVSSGYFIVLPQNDGNKTPQTWQIKTHMTISGEAKDHAALSQFIQRLFGHEKIIDVKVQSTSRRQYDKVQVVQFELVVLVNNQGKVS